MLAGKRGGNPAAGQDEAALGSEDISRFIEAVNFGRRELLSPAKVIRAKYRLGPRGVWIIGLIASGRIRYQSDIARLWNVGRSMVTEEIGPLRQAKLLSTSQNSLDRRKIDLVLLPAGLAVNEELGNEFSRIISDRLQGYSRGDILRCTALMNDLAGPVVPTDEPLRTKLAQSAKRQDDR